MTELLSVEAAHALVAGTLIRCNTAPRAARDHIGPARDNGDTKAMACRRHGGVSGPAISLGIVTLDLVECARRGLAAEDQYLAVNDCCGDAAASCGHACARVPAISRQVVLLVRRQVARLASVDPAADHIDSSVDHRRGQMVSRGRQRRTGRPGVAGWVIDLVSRCVAAA